MQNEFLEEAVEIDLKETEIAARTDGRAIMIAQFAVGEQKLGKLTASPTIRRGRPPAFRAE